MTKKRQTSPRANLKVERVPIDSISLDPANLRRHSDRNLSAIEASLRRFGQQTPIVVDAAGVIRKGNGTWEAAKAIGWTEIEIIRTALKDSEAVAYAIADNRTTDLSEFDEQALADVLQALDEFDASLVEAAGFDTDWMSEIATPSLEAGADANDPDREWEGMPEFENEDQTGIKAIIHFETEADKEAFEKLVGQKIPANTKAIWYPAKKWADMKSLSYADSGDES